MKKKFSILNILSIGLTVICFSALFYPIIANYISSQRMSQVIHSYNSSVSKLKQNQMKKMIDAAGAYNAYLYEMSEFGLTTLPQPDYKSLLNITKTGVMCYLDIPELNISGMTVSHGDSEATLLMGLGHIPQTSLPIGGVNTHVGISGHSGRADDSLFTDLGKLKMGDVFYIHTLNLKMKYQINDISIVSPSDNHLLNIQTGKDLVTLVTCYPPGINNERLLVTGERVPLDSNTPQEKINRNPYDYNFWVMLVSILFISFGISFWLIRRLKKREQE